MADRGSKEMPRGVGEAKEDAASKRPGKENTGRWSYEEHRLFLKGLEMHGKGWKKIAELIKTRTVVQIRTHAQKYFQKLAKAKQGGGEPGAVLLDRGLGRKNGKRKSGSLEGTAVAPSLQPYMTMPGVNGSVESGLYKFLSPNVITSFVDDDQAAAASQAAAANAARAAAAEAAAAEAARAGAAGEKGENGGFGYAPTPDWYARGNNVDVLLNEAEGLDWLADSGGTNEGANEEKAEAAVPEGSRRGPRGGVRAKLEPMEHGLGGTLTTPSMHRSVSNPEAMGLGVGTGASFGAEEATSTLDELLGQRSHSLGDLPMDEDDIIIGATLGIDEDDDGEPPGYDMDDEDASMDILHHILHRDPLAVLDGEADGMHIDGVDFAREIESLAPTPAEGATSPAAAEDAGLYDGTAAMQLDFDELGML